MKKPIVAGMLILSLAACKPSADIATVQPHALPASSPSPAPSSSMPAMEQPSNDVVAFVEANYGDRDAVDGAFLKDDERYSICAYRRSVTPDKRHYLAMCSDGDPTQRQVDLYVLRADADDVEATHTGIPAPAAEVSVVPLGDERLGFAVSQSLINQGHGIGSTALYAPKDKDDELRQVADFVSLLDNTAVDGCAQSEHGCERITRSLADSPSESGLVVIEHGQTNGVTQENRYTLKFDPASGGYAVPSDLQRSY